MPSSVKRIGITGASGVLGRTLQQVAPSVEWCPFPGRMEDFAGLQAWVKQFSPFDSVIHLASLVPTRAVEADPRQAFLSNVQGTLNLLEAIRTRPTGTPLPWIFLCSTAHVYASSAVPLTENSRLEPVTLYGRTKLQAEEWGRIYADKYGLEICIGRVFSFSSPLQAKSYFIPAMAERLKAAARGAMLEIHGLEGSRDFLSARQVCQAINFLCEQRPQGVFNIGSGRPQQLSDVVGAIARKLHREDVRVLALKQGTNHLVSNVDKLAALGFTVDIDVDRFIAETVTQS